jgi:predicted nucleotidyltransferase
MWIDDLPAELSRQRRVLQRLLTFCESTDDARSLAVSCSLARGAGDELSDVDAGLGVRDDAVETSRLAAKHHDARLPEGMAAYVAALWDQSAA